jgi:hypothetical protein
MTHHRAESGTVSLVALFLALALGGLSVGLVHESHAARQAVQRQETSLKALEIAEAGVARAEVELRAQEDGGVDGIGNVSGTYGHGTYEVTTTPDAVSADRYVIHAKGTHGLSTRRIEVGVRRRKKASFVDGLFSKDNLVANGNERTDAYDSRVGTYASQAVNSDAGGTYALQGGSVGSNKAIDINGTAVHIRGNAIPGPLYEVDLSGSPTISGDMIPREEEIPVADPPLAEFTAAATTNQNGTWTVNHGSVTYNAARATMRVNPGTELVLAAGTYFFSDLSLKSGATLRVTGPVRIYATGDVDLAGGAVVNASGRSTDLLLYVHPYPLPTTFDPPHTEVKIAGGPQCAAGIYAPGAQVTISGNADFFGAVVAKDIVLNGDTYFHYDLALGEIGTEAGATFERLYWREIAPPRR